MVPGVIFRAFFHAAIGADLTAPPWMWEWLDMADPANRDAALLPPGAKGRLLEETIPVNVGKRGDASSASPSNATCELLNGDGWLTPGHPLSPWFGQWGEDTPARLGVYAGAPYLLLEGDGSRASTPHVSALNTPGEVFVVWELWPPVWDPPFFYAAGKYQVTSDQRSWRVDFIDGGLDFSWTTDGGGATFTNARSDALPGRPEGGPFSIGLHWLGNNGAEGRRTRFYAGRVTADGLEADLASFLFDEVTQAGTSTIFNSTAPLEIGGLTATGLGADDAFRGQSRRFRVRSAPGGPLLADLDATVLSPGATGQTDAATRVWAFTGAPVTNAQVRLTGEVSSITPVWPHGDVDGLARVAVTVSGVTRRMRQGSKALSSPLRRRIDAQAVAGEIVVYVPMEDGRDATGFAAATPGVPLTGFGGVVNLASNTRLAASAPLPTIPGGQGGGWLLRVPVTSAVTQWRALIAFEVPTLSSTEVPLLAMLATGTIRRLTVQANNTIFRILGYNSSETEVINDNFAATDIAGDWKFLQLELLQDGANIDYAAEFLALGALASTGGGGTIAGTVGNVHGVQNLAVAPADGLSFGHCVVTSNLDLGWLAGEKGATVAFAGEAALDRLVRLGDEEATTVVVEGDPALSAEMGPQRQLPLLSLLEECAQVDMGVLAELRHQPGHRYRARHTLYNQAPRLVIDAGLRIPFSGTRDDRRRRNDRTVTRPDGASARAVLPEVEAGTKTRYDDSTPLNVAADHQLGDLAGWLLHLGTWPEMRYPNLGVKLAKALVDPDTEHLVDDWLSVTEGDKVRVANLPAQHPTSSVEQLVEGWSEQFSGAGWDPAMSGQPAGPWTVGVLQDDVLGRCDTDGTTLDSGVDADDTSWSVTSADADHRWIDSATFGAMFPFDLMIAGERVTATAISGTGATQTLTVVRSVNGVVKAHDAGTALSLADPWRLAL